MSSVLAIVSKAVFEKLAGGAGVGDVLPLDRYNSLHKGLAALGAGGALFLVTVRPPDEQLWLVGVLEGPTCKADGWYAKAPNAQPIASLRAVKGKLRFASGTGLVAKPGALGMSLQTPRVLTDGDVALLRGGKRPASVPPPKLTKPAKRAVPPTRGKQQRGAARDPGVGFLAVKAAVAVGDGPAALAAGLAWWRADRSPAIADLVDQISERVSSPGVTSDAAFSKLALGKQALAVGALLAAIPTLPVSFLPTAAELLAGFPDDPRIARAVAAWAIDPPTTSTSTYPFWTRLLDVVARTGDVRAIPLLKKRLAKKPEKSQFWPKFYKALARTVAALADAPAGATTTVAKLAIDKLTAVTPIAATRPAIENPAKLDGSLLAQATTHLGRGDVVPAIGAMVRCWRDHRAPELADLVDRTSRLLPTYDHPIASTAKASLDPWLALFASDAVGALPRLARDISVGGPKLAERRLVTLADVDDPRLSIRLAELAAFPASPERTQYWKMILESLARLRDVRVRAPLAETFGDFKGDYYDHHRQARRIIAPFCAETDTPQLPATEAALMPGLAAAVAKLEKSRTTERELVAAIVDDWKSDGPRQVYADWLLEREHPRGELIQLLLANDTGAAALAQTPYIWGALEDLGPLQLERGIPRQCTLDWRWSVLSWRNGVRAPLVAALDAIDIEDDELPRAPDLAAMRAAATRWATFRVNGKAAKLPPRAQIP